MKSFWFSSLALHISLNSSEVLPGMIGGGSLPSAVRGRLWAIIHRRQRFWARWASAPSQNIKATSGVRISSPGRSTRCVQFLAGDDPQTAAGVAGKRGGPLARPAHGQDQPAAGHRQVVVGKGVIGAPSALGRQPQLGLGRQDLFERLIEIRRAGVALVVFRAETRPPVRARSGCRSPGGWRAWACSPGRCS